MNAALEDCPVWVTGEMYCAGVQLAQGYWRNEEKTHANFITHPRTGDRAERTLRDRIYRTGDLGRYLPDGNIEFCGRADFQIKIRGYRIETGEIEAALMQHPAVRTAVITAIGQHNSKERLVAYIVLEQFQFKTFGAEPKIEDLHNFLSEKLPEYMLPSAFIFLDNLPLSANGKVNLLALPTQETLLQEFAVTYVAPQNDVQQMIAKIWQELLGLEKVGVNHNFFDIGGNSLTITQVYSQLKKSWIKESNYLSVIDLFKYPTIRLLANYLNQNEYSHSSQKEQITELAQKLEDGKNRLKQRFLKLRHES